MSNDADRHGTASPVRLQDIRPGERARVVGYREDSAYGEQLMQLGLIPGTRIELQRRAPLGDPVAIGFRGFCLALRPDEAECLLLEKL